MKIRRFLFLAVLSPGLAWAQSFRFDDGRVAAPPQAEVRGDAVVVNIGSGGGEAFINYPARRIVAMDWPAPPELLAVEAALAKGRVAEELPALTRLLSAQHPFRTVAGSWWSRGQQLRARALAISGNSLDVEVAVERLRENRPPAELLMPAEIALVGILLRENRHADAKERVKKLRAQASDDGSLAGLAVLDAKLMEQQGETERALLAYLRVPVYHPTESAVLREALSGAIACLDRLGDTARASRLRAELAALKD